MVTTLSNGYRLTYTLNNKKMKKKVRKRWTQAEADTALVRMKPALAYNYEGDDRDALRGTFRNADLSGLNLRDAYFSNANLERAWIMKAFPL